MPSRWTLTITCPRPANRARDDWHVQPHRLRETTTAILGKNAEITLTARTARLRLTGEGRCRGTFDLAHEHFASALAGLFMDVQHTGSRYVLPRPVRTELRQDDE